MRALVASPHLRRLKVLDLGGNGITDEGAAVLASWSAMASVEWLDLSDNDLTDAGVKALAASPHAAGLRGLSSNSNEVGPEGIRALLDSPHLTGLAEFSLHEECDPGPKLWRAVKARFGVGSNDFGGWAPPRPY